MGSTCSDDTIDALLMEEITVREEVRVSGEKGVCYTDRVVKTEPHKGLLLSSETHWKEQAYLQKVLKTL
jgi:hypothetical protein